MKSIGIAGTAKNTGKTTTLSAVMDILKQRDIRLALTSIGYDGEAMDNVTGLPKPRIVAYEGDIAAVAQQCLRASEAQLDVLEDTGIQTAMGHILIGRVKKPGKLVLAGPNKRRELRDVLNRLDTYGADLCIVDGALNRMAPLVEVDGLILSTGAARHTDIGRLAKESGIIMDLFSLPAMPEQGHVESVSSVFTQSGYEALITEIEKADTLHIEGVIACEYLNELAHSGHIAGKRLLFGDPIKLLLAGTPEEAFASLHLLQNNGAVIGVTHGIRTIAVTVNPYYPKFRYTSGDYDAAYVDKDALLAAITASVHAPCYDVVRQGADGIAKAIQELL